MNNVFTHKQFLAYRALGRSLIMRLVRISLLLFQNLLHVSLDLWLFSTVLSSNISYVSSGLLLGLLASEMIGETSFNLYYAKFKGHLYAILASPISDYAILMSYISSSIFRGATMLILALIISHFMVGIQIMYPLQFILLACVVAIFFCMIGLLEGIYARSFMQSGFASRLVLGILSTFSGALGPIPVKYTLARQLMRLNPVYYMNNMMRYYMVGTAEFVPQNILLLQMSLINLVLFVIVVQCFKSLRK